MRVTVRVASNIQMSPDRKGKPGQSTYIYHIPLPTPRPTIPALPSPHPSSRPQTTPLRGGVLPIRQIAPFLAHPPPALKSHQSAPPHILPNPLSALGGGHARETHRLERIRRAHPWGDAAGDPRMGKGPSFGTTPTPNPTLRRGAARGTFVGVSLGVVRGRPLVGGKIIPRLGASVVSANGMAFSRKTTSKRRGERRELVTAEDARLYATRN